MINNMIKKMINYKFKFFLVTVFRTIMFSLFFNGSTPSSLEWSVHAKLQMATQNSSMAA